MSYIHRVEKFISVQVSSVILSASALAGISKGIITATSTGKNTDSHKAELNLGSFNCLYQHINFFL